MHIYIYGIKNGVKICTQKTKVQPEGGKIHMNILQSHSEIGVTLLSKPERSSPCTTQK